MSEHTPGPWSYTMDKDCGGDFKVTADHGKTEIVNGCGCCDSPWVSSEADARLMAAAPDLFEALDSAYQKISDELERLYHNAFPSCCGKVTVSECCGDLEQTWTAEDSQAMDFLAPIHEAMRAALAKAKGDE